MARDLVAGAKAPPFMLPRDGGSKVSLKDFKGSNLVLYFYPRADTPGCTKEAIAFSRFARRFCQGRNRDPRGFRRPRRSPGQVQVQT
jgi:peroxiredoxin Q/BCP